MSPRFPQAGKLAVQANGGLSKGEQQQMSDAVLVALIIGTPGIIASLLNVAVTLKQGKANQIHMQDTKVAVQETQAAVQANRDAMEHLEKNTNSIKDALVKVTAESSRAIGRLEGRAEQKAETSGSEEYSG
jgi:type IV secretory pathway TrbL component